MTANFENVTFRGTFRNYQQEVLDKSAEYLNDGKIHIVAAPGSGKTILGLELIRRLDSPTLILSPSVTIRQQWAERFEERFLPQGEVIDDYVSSDLKNPRLMTSVTYQALHAAHSRSVNVAFDDDLVVFDEEESSIAEDMDQMFQHAQKDMGNFQDYDLLETIEAQGIKVICLDEAHHLRSEWQKALEAFVGSLQNEVTVIALTATPPYDSTKAEWARYVSLCGEIDEEIFVPQLVKQKTLCPHQDYVYFNYPTVKEKEVLNKYKSDSYIFCNQIMRSGFIEEALALSGIVEKYNTQPDLYFKNETAFATLLQISFQRGSKLPKPLLKLFFRSSKPQDFVLEKKSNWDKLEATFQFIIDSPDVFSEDFSQKLRKQLSQQGLIKRNKVYLLSNARLNRMLILSMGKLQSIEQIALLESRNLGDDLRMLVLTDHIKKDLLPRVGTGASFNTMGLIPVFETLRNVLGEGQSIAALSGSLVIVPQAITNIICDLAKERRVECSFKPLPYSPDYCEVFFSGSNKSKVAVLTDAFQAGHIQILVGTKSLLGEGWDSPCINSLILATFVGSFMLSNQMRGRAIRVDHQVPDKTANIWHLVTLDPFFDNEEDLLALFTFSGIEQMQAQPIGEDWETLVRRFDCFMGPAYTNKVVESGIERIDIIKAPFNAKGIAHINGKMEARAADRKAMAQQWDDSLIDNPDPKVIIIDEIPDFKIPPRVTLQNFLPAFLFATLDLLVVYLMITFARFAMSVDSFPLIVGGFILVIALNIFGIRAIIKLSYLTSPRKVIESLGSALLDTLKAVGLVESFGAKLRITEGILDQSFQFALINASAHDQNIFAAAMEEMLSPIKSPKYVLIKKHAFRFFGEKFLYWHSYSCPLILSDKKENAELFQKNLEKRIGKFALVYTYNATGRDSLWRCCCFSYINLNEEVIRKRIVDSY